MPHSKTASPFDPETPAPAPEIAAPRFRYTRPIREALSLIDVAFGFLRGVSLDSAWLEEVTREAHAVEAHYSTAIEGTQLTLEQSRSLMAGELLAGVSTDVRRELLNYRFALDRVRDYVKEEGRVTETVLLQVHKDLVQGVRGESGHPGSYRRIQVILRNETTGATVYTPPEPELVQVLMGELFIWLGAQFQSSGDESDLHPALVAGIAQFWLLHIHPFIDGNGRVSRLLSTLILLAAGNEFADRFSLSAVYDQDKGAYYQAIQGVREVDLDLTGWLEYFSQALMKQMRDLAQQASVEQQLREYGLRNGLTDRQLAIIRLLNRRPDLGTIRDIEEHIPDVARRTLQRDLERLEALKAIRAVGATTKRNWQLLLTFGAALALGMLLPQEEQD